MRRLAALVLLLPLTACPQDKDGEPAGTDSEGSSTGAPDEDCAFLPGKSFREDVGYPCPLDPNTTCYDQISFQAATYDYYHDDYVSSGEYACKDGVIDETGSATPAIGTIDAAAGKLTWKKKAFTVTP